MAEVARDPEFMTSLARGLAVLRCFADERKPMTVARASQATGLSRSAVKRCLHTLVALDYAARQGSAYLLRPKVLALGYAFLSSSTLATRAQPLLDRLRDDLRESSSIGVIEEDEVYYVARAEVSRIMSISLRVGSRLPLYCTSMGRVLLGGRTPAERVAYLDRVLPVALTDRTETDPARLLALLDAISAEGFAIVDQELEIGLRSIAVPVVANGDVVAALNIGVPAGRVSIADMRSRYLPALRRVARDLVALL